MKRAVIAVTLTVAMFATSGCGGDGTDSGTPKAAAGSSQDQNATPSESATAAPAAPAFRLLPKGGLEAALLTIQDMPVGYSQDPPSKSGNKTFCDYKQPVTEKAYVSRDFTKGGGMSAVLLRVGLREFKSSGDARAAFNALTKALATCHTETYEGSKLVYSPMSAPKVGDEAVGVRITADGTALLQNFALIGPTIVNTGGGGFMQADADEIAGLLRTQVMTYQDAATN